jgi:Methylamine utilisation protein MauE
MVVTALLLRFALAAIFLHAGTVKLSDLGEFRTAVRNYRLLPEFAVAPVAVALPLAEVACGVLLVFGVGTGPVAAVLVLLLAVFVVAIAVNLLRGRTFSCGCSGTTSSDITWRHVAVNAVLAVLAALVSAWAAQPLTVAAGWGLRGGSPVSQEAAVAILMAAVTVAVLALLVREAFIVQRLAAVRRNQSQSVSEVVK